MLRRSGNADADRQRQVLVTGDQRSRLDGVPDSLGRAPALRQSGLRQDHGEFLAAMAANIVAFAHAGPQDTADCLQRLVAGLVSVSIVDLLEMIEIHDEQRHADIGAPSLCQFLRNQRVVGPTVRQAGQGIGEGIHLEALFAPHHAGLPLHHRPHHEDARDIGRHHEGDQVQGETQRIRQRQQDEQPDMSRYEQAEHDEMTTPRGLAMPVQLAPDQPNAGGQHDRGDPDGRTGTAQHHPVDRTGETCHQRRGPADERSRQCDDDAACIDDDAVGEMGRREHRGDGAHREHWRMQPPLQRRIRHQALDGTERQGDQRHQAKPVQQH